MSDDEEKPHNRMSREDDNETAIAKLEREQAYDESDEEETPLKTGRPADASAREDRDDEVSMVLACGFGLRLVSAGEMKH